MSWYLLWFVESKNKLSSGSAVRWLWDSCHIVSWLLKWSDFLRMHRWANGTESVFSALVIGCRRKSALSGRSSVASTRVQRLVNGSLGPWRKEYMGVVVSCWIVWDLWELGDLSSHNFPVRRQGMGLSTIFPYWITVIFPNKVPMKVSVMEAHRKKIGKGLYQPRSMVVKSSSSLSSENLKIFGGSPSPFDAN